MKKRFSLIFCSIMLFGQTTLFAQTKPISKQASKQITSKPLQKTKPAVKPILKPGIKIPAKTSPSVRIKTKITPRKTVVKEKPAKLPVGVNKNENAEIAPSAREVEMIREINILRRDPKGYIPFVETYMKQNSNKKDVQTGGRELIKQLKELQPLPALTLNPVMYSAARQFGLSLKEQDDIDHSDLPYFENLSLGHPDIREAIVDMLIDDGIPDRGHRTNLLNPTISKIAVYEVPGKVQGYINCYVQEFK